jgi:hypothetical protein
VVTPDFAPKDVFEVHRLPPDFGPRPF